MLTIKAWASDNNLALHIQTTDLAVAQFNRANDEAAYTKAWAEWTVGAKVALLAECSA